MIIKTYFILFIIIVNFAATNAQEMEIWKAKKILDIQAKLGEGALWEPQKEVLLWVDIEGRKLMIFNPEKGTNEVIDVEERIGTVVPVDQKRALLALQNGIFYLDYVTGSRTLIVNPLDTIENIRFNDGKCDPAGRFWVGTMKLKGPPKQAALYCLYNEHDVSIVEQGITISNGLVWSNNKKTMFYIDTPVRKVAAYDYDHQTGKISNKRFVIEVDKAIGAPDGMAIDEEGMLWIALWGGEAVGRFDPNTGEMIGKVEVPGAKNITSCAFGGKDLNQLYITSASVGMKDEEKEIFPDAGSLFMVQTGIKGMKANYFKP